MTLWSYKASAAGGAVRVGRLSAEDVSAVRATLRRLELEPIDIRPIRARPRPVFVERWLRNRRRAERADLFDALVTMLEAGLPLVDSLATLAEQERRQTARGSLAARLTESIRSGDGLAAALRAEPSWFDGAECAMVAAGERSGELAGVLRSLAERHLRSGELGSKIASALFYPSVVLFIGLAVVWFLGSHTLPNLVAILADAGVEPPALTTAVMSAAGVIGHLWWIAPLAVLGGMAAITLGARVVPPEHVARIRSMLPRLMPAALRHAIVGEALLLLAEMLRAGVTLVEALRVVGPTLVGPGSRAMAVHAGLAAERIERGDPVHESLAGGPIDHEAMRLIALGVTAGELETVLVRVGQRSRRRARRATDRLTALLEPAVILVLASLIGVVVLAAVLPLVRLQEVL